MEGHQARREGGLARPTVTGDPNNRRALHGLHEVGDPDAQVVVGGGLRHSAGSSHSPSAYIVGYGVPFLDPFRCEVARCAACAMAGWIEVTLPT